MKRTTATLSRPPAPLVPALPSTETNSPGCETCRYWREDQHHEHGSVGDCRRAPPVIVSDMLPRRVDPNEPWEAVLDATQFPRTWNDDWCGQHEAAACRGPDVAS